MELWLNESDVVIDPGRVARFRFEAPANLQGALIWIAPRIVLVREERPLPVMRLELNGQVLKADRLVSGKPHYGRTCHVEWPIRDMPKCKEGEKPDCWVVRPDDDFVVGNDPADGKFSRTLHGRRALFTRDFEASYALDIYGPVREGQNELVIEYLLPKEFEVAPDVDLPANPPRPWLALHAEFVRAGVIAEDEIAHYNGERIRNPDALPLVFNALAPDQFRAMVRHYETTAPKATCAEDRALFHFGIANLLLWKGRNADAEQNLTASLDADPRGPFAANSLFLLGASRANTGDGDGAEETWSRLTAMFRSSIWADVARREKVLRSPRGIAGLIHWPKAEAVRVNRPPVLDGRLGDPAWRNAPPTDEWTNYGSRFARASLKTECRILYDQNGLYLGFVCQEPVMDEVFNTCIKRDSGCWGEDCVEFFINPRRDYACTYEFELGIEGGIVDCLNIWDISHMQYDPPWDYRTAKFDDHWTAEMAIPWESIGGHVPQPGDIWLCNPTRVRPASANREGLLTCLGPSFARFAALEALAYLVFK